MLKEIIGIIVNPIFMLTRLRSDALNIIDFVRDYTLSHKELGNVCKFGVFEYGVDPLMNSQRLSDTNISASCIEVIISFGTYRRKYCVKFYSPEGRLN